MDSLLAALIVVAFAGATPGAAPPGGPVTLSVKPVLCITDRRNQDCRMSFLVVWESQAAGHYCLFNDFSGAPLDCWEHTSAGRFEEDRVVVQSFSYWLTARDAGVRLAEATVEVMTTESSDRRRSRRHRHAWSVL